MPKIAPQRYAEVLRVLENSFLTGGGYEISEQPDKQPDSTLILFIRVKDFPNFSIRLDRIKQRKGINLSMVVEDRTFLLCTESPGDTLNQEDTELPSFQNFLFHLERWCERVANLILGATPSQRLDDFRAQIDKILAEHVADEDAHFTDDEKKDLYTKLDELQKKFDQAFSNSATREEETERLDKVISEMKQAAGAMPKKAWFRTLAYKISTFTVSEGGKALIESSVKGLLGFLGQ